MSDIEQSLLSDKNLDQLTEELPFEQYLSFKIATLTNALTRQMDRFLQDTYKLSHSDWRVIAILGRYGSASVREIVAHSNMDKGLVSRIVARLVKNQLVSSKTDPDDRRLVILSNTEKGSALYGEIQPQTRKRQRALLSLLAEEERCVFYSALNKLSEFANKDNIVKWEE